MGIKGKKLPIMKLSVKLGGLMDRLTELLKEVMRLNNEMTAVLIQLSVYLKENK